MNKSQNPQIKAAFRQDEEDRGSWGIKIIELMVLDVVVTHGENVRISRTKPEELKVNPQSDLNTQT